MFPRSLLLLLGAALAVGAEDTLPLLAARAPLAAAAQAAAVAAERAAGAAGRREDPMLGVGRTRLRDGDRAWWSDEIRLEQELPRWGAPGAARAAAAAEIARRWAERRRAVGEVAAEAAAALADHEAVQARQALLTATRARLEVLLTRSATGVGRTEDDLALRSRLALLVADQADLERQAADAAEQVRAVLGLPAAAPLPSFAVPASSDRLTPDQDLAEAATAAADADLGSARATRHPATALGLRWEREADPAGTMHAVGLEVRIGLPLGQAAAGAEEEAALARRQAARAEALWAQRRAEALRGRAARAAVAAQAARQAATEITTRLEAGHRAALAAGGQDLLPLLEVLDRLAEAEDRRITAERDERQAAAALWVLFPPDITP